MWRAKRATQTTNTQTTNKTTIYGSLRSPTNKTTIYGSLRSPTNTQTSGGGMGEPGFPQKVEKKEKQNKQLNTI